MPYGDFVAREDVYGIISKTLTDHYGKEVRVTEKNEKTDSKNSMYCFPWDYYTTEAVQTDQATSK